MAQGRPHTKGIETAKPNQVSGRVLQVPLVMTIGPKGPVASLTELDEMEEETSKHAQRKLDLDSEPTKKWVNFFGSNGMSAKEMSLNYVAPVMKNGEKVIELNKQEFDKDIEEWKQAVLYVVRDSPTIKARLV
ncbi:hypothetical protein FXO37_27379 [Capsicum annuum]|nr:hypothetical protein FXO37_27379 [Capsicum annuum]